MRNCTLLLALLASSAGALFAQDISGDWQGTGGWAGSDRYLNLRAFFSSKALGLSDVEAACACPLG